MRKPYGIDSDFWFTKNVSIKELKILFNFLNWSTTNAIFHVKFYSLSFNILKMSKIQSRTISTHNSHKHSIYLHSRTYTPFHSLSARHYHHPLRVRLLSPSLYLSVGLEHFPSTYTNIYMYIPFHTPFFLISRARVIYHPVIPCACTRGEISRPSARVRLWFSRLYFNLTGACFSFSLSLSL